jgi:hypothetical protein
MRITTVSVCFVSLGCFLALGPGLTPHRLAPAKLTLDMATIHAAALSSARGPADSTDAPYLLVSILGTGGRTEAKALPATGHWAMRFDQAINGMPITSITLQPGDSVRILFSVLEDSASHPGELQAATATSNAMASKRALVSPPVPSLVTEALAPLTSRGAFLLGSASLLLTNEGGTTYWNSLDCITNCEVVRPPAEAGSRATLAETATRPVTGLVELTGASSTYHFQVALKRVP